MVRFKAFKKRPLRTTLLQLGPQALQLAQLLAAPIRTVGFRPEHVRIGVAGDGQVGLTLQDCETQAVEHLGDRAFCYLRSSLGELVVLAPDGDTRLSGTLQLSVDASALHFFDATDTALH